MNQNVENTLQKGIIAKESKQFSEASSLFTQAIIESIENEYPHGALHGLLNIGTIWKLKAREGKTQEFGKLAYDSFLAAREYALENNLGTEEVIHATFLIGQAAFEIGNYDEAEKLYQESYDFYSKNVRSIAHLGDIKRHLGSAKIKLGKRDGVLLLQEALNNIREFDEKDSYDKKNYVWETGALLSLADAVRDEDKLKAVKYAQEALTIATDKELVIRKEEAERMLHTLE